MDESFLLEQLIRIREMSERVSNARRRAAEVSEQITRERELMRKHPLYQVKDFRTSQTYDPLESPPQDSSSARASSRRRRRP